MICDICGSDSVNSRFVTRSYGEGNELLIIENIPINICSHCGESYFTAEILHEIERIKIHRDGFTHEKSVPVATFAQTHSLHADSVQH